MMTRNRTPYADDALRVENGTTPDEIREFVRRRGSNPRRIGGLRVWNFNNHELNVEALREQGDDFLYDDYVVPYQASGVWAYMASLLPKEVKEAEILAYNQENGRYLPYPNYFRHSDRGPNQETLTDIAKAIR